MDCLGEATWNTFGRGVTDLAHCDRTGLFAHAAGANSGAAASTHNHSSKPMFSACDRRRATFLPLMVGGVDHLPPDHYSRYVFESPLPDIFFFTLDMKPDHLSILSFVLIRVANRENRIKALAFAWFSAPSVNDCLIVFKLYQSLTTSPFNIFLRTV